MELYYHTFVLLLAFLATGSTAPSHFDLGNDHWRIIGGSDAPEGKFPYQVSIRYTNNQHFCGGSILNKRHILTAAHCFQGILASPIKIVVGTNKINYGGDTYRVNNIVIHKDFNPNTFVNDIAIVKLSKDIEFSDKVKTIEMSDSNTGGGVELILTGWGDTSYPSRFALPNNLQMLKLKSTTVEYCQKVYKDFGPWGKALGPKQLCAQANYKQGACKGDSGGPLVGTDGKQVGVVSWGKPCAQGVPDVYTRVSAYRQWIIDNSRI